MFLKMAHKQIQKSWEEFDLFEKIAGNNLWQALPYLRLSSCGQSDLSISIVQKCPIATHCNIFLQQALHLQ